MPHDPLEGIDAIHWDELRRAYGGAEDVPDRLRGFLGTVDAADDARDLVMSALWHQGSVFSASAAAVPFLAKLLAASGVRGRGALAAGLVLIAVGARRAGNADVLAALAGSSADLGYLLRPAQRPRASCVAATPRALRHEADPTPPATRPKSSGCSRSRRFST